MLFGLLGDVHGDFEAMERAFESEPNAAAWLSVGDIASDTGLYPSPSRPFFFIKGNNEDFDLVARLAAGESVGPNLHFIPNGEVIDVAGSNEQPSVHSPGPAPERGPRCSLRVAGLGGTFAPTWYETAPGDLPASAPGRSNVRRSSRPDDGSHHPSRRSIGGAPDSSSRSRLGDGAAKADKRRHFVRAEVEACLALGGIEVFLTHEAARPYWVGTGRRRNDAGKAVINEILAAMRPRLHVFGHHHRFSERLCEGVPSIGLPLADAGCLLLETDGWTWSFRDSPM